VHPVGADQTQRPRDGDRRRVLGMHMGGEPGDALGAQGANRQRRSLARVTLALVIGRDRPRQPAVLCTPEPVTVAWIQPTATPSARRRATQLRQTARPSGERPFTCRA
jgi:hypothetical protein